MVRVVFHTAREVKSLAVSLGGALALPRLLLRPLSRPAALVAALVGRPEGALVLDSTLRPRPSLYYYLSYIRYLDGYMQMPWLYDSLGWFLH